MRSRRGGAAAALLGAALRCSLLFAACDGGGGSAASRPRGVPLAKAPLYEPGERFACLDGSYAVPYAFVNDDYCDCRDGTDEPGTAACANGAFHCANVGHEPRDIPSSRVNDGVCDCCDGADEWAGAAQCRDECDELGREARLEAQRRARLLRKGAELRRELVREGAAAKGEMRERLDELRKNRDEAERLRQERERLKSEAEELEKLALDHHREEEEKLRADEREKEARDVFGKFDTDGDERLTIEEIKLRPEFDADADGVVSDEEAQRILGDNLSVSFEEFLSVSWKMVEDRLRVDDEVEAETEPETEIEPPEDIETEAPGDSESETEEDTSEDESESEELQTEPPHAPSKPQYDDETQKLIDSAAEARDGFATADRAVRDIDSEIAKLEGSLAKDYGPEGEFATLAGKCIEYSDREYTYKLCPFDRASQRPKNGGAETDLGTWGEWSGGDGGRKYSAMLYSRGAGCWNGPDRSARVEVTCGLDDRIVSVAEPNRCEYAFEMETPAACVDAEAAGAQPDRHDEL